MKTLALLTLQLSLLLTTPCIAQQLVWPLNPQLGGFPPGHPGIPIVLDEGTDWNSADLNVGDMVLLEMRDRPAAAYLRLFGHDVADSGVGTSLEARVIKIADGEVVLEFQITASRDTDSARIITVTSTPRLQQLSGPPKYSEPVSVNGGENEKKLRELRMRQAKLPRVRIDSFDRTKIRTWTLANEISE
jgi:uncharacterized protein YbaA (DUF1428 family)